MPFFHAHHPPFSLFLLYNFKQKLSMRFCVVLQKHGSKLLFSWFYRQKGK